MLRFKIFEKFDSECYKNFETLKKNAEYNFFQSFNYLKNLSLKNKSKIKIVSIYDDNEIVAILPLEIKKYFFFNILQWIGSRRSDVCNPILIKNFDSYINHKNFVSIWENILNKIGKYDLIFLNNQISKVGNCFNPFTQYLNSKKISKIYQIILPENFQEYLDNQKNLDKKKYYEIHRIGIKLKKLEEKLDVVFDIKKLPYESIEFKDIVKKKIDQLKNKKIKHNLDQNFIEIFEDLIKNKNENYYLASLKIENKIISSCFGILLNNKFYYYIPSMDTNAYDYYKPGKILVLKIPRKSKN